MKLPNPDQLVVEREKIADYLLNAAHPDNGGKAAFFAGLGFRRDRWETLAHALASLARQAAVTEASPSSHGQKYVIVGPIKSPSGRMGMVKTIWIVDHGVDVARLVTAYPHKK